MSKKYKNHVDKELIFIYNADSDLLSKVSDFAHKVISPNTYSCSLCKLTHGTLTMHREWSEFLQGLHCKIRFEYKDKWKGKGTMEFPLIFLKAGNKKEVIASPGDLNKIIVLQELMDLIKSKCS